MSGGQVRSVKGHSSEGCGRGGDAPSRGSQSRTCKGPCRTLMFRRRIEREGGEGMSGRVFVQGWEGETRTRASARGKGGNEERLGCARVASSDDESSMTTPLSSVGHA